MDSEVTTKTYWITDLAESERPRERLLRQGAGALTTAELLAILLRVDVPADNAVQVGQRLLLAFNGLTGFHRAPITEISSQHGIGASKAAQTKAAIELVDRLTVFSLKEWPAIHSPDDVP